VENLIYEIERLDLKVIVAVIDDSSPDGTAERVMKLQERYGNVHLVSRYEKLGLGTAIADGFRYVLGLRNTPEYIVTMDSDYSHSPQDIPKLVNVAKEGCDLVIGSRYIHGGEMKDWPLKRRLISRFANIIATVAIGARVHDCTSGFRCYSKHYVKDVLSNLHSQTYEIQIETIRQARLNKFVVKEIPIAFTDRKKGKSKLTTAEIQDFLVYFMKATFIRLLFDFAEKIECTIRKVKT
jgi:dolichol-phosphate mannosyltransferase